MFFQIREDGHLDLCAETDCGQINMIELTPPDDFIPEEMHNWMYINGEFVYAPIQEPDTPHQKTDAERIDELEARLNAYEAAYVEGVNQA